MKASLSAALLFLLLTAVALGQDDQKALMGEWALESLTSEGTEVPASGYTLLIKDGEWTEFKDSKVLSTMVYKADPTASPKTIDFSGKDGGTVSPSKGIYELDGDMLRVAAGNERPTEFKTAPGSKSEVSIYRRELSKE